MNPGAHSRAQARNPPKPVEVEVYADGTNEWTTGLNKDVGATKATKKEKKEAKEVSAALPTRMAVCTLSCCCVRLVTASGEEEGEGEADEEGRLSC